MKELRDKLKKELEGLDKKIINLNLLEGIEYFILRIIQEIKKKRKRIIKNQRNKKLIRELNIKFGEYNKKDDL